MESSRAICWEPRMETLYYTKMTMNDLIRRLIYQLLLQKLILLIFSMYQQEEQRPNQQQHNQQARRKKEQKQSSSQVDLQKLNPNSDNSPPSQNEIHLQSQEIQNSEYWLNSKVNSKWNNPIQNEKKGRFTQQQQKILSTAVGQFLAISEITYEEFEIILNEKNVVNKILKKHNFFNLLSNLIPNRSANSCYRFLKRSFNQSNRKGKWKKEQEQKLISLVQKYGRQWIVIGKQMGRTSDNVYDKYRSMGSNNVNKRKKCSWSLKQLIDFIAMVNKRSQNSFLNNDIYKQLQAEREHNIIDHLQRSKSAYNTKKFTFHNYRIVLNYLQPNIKDIILDNINWSRIAEKMQTRSFIDCKNKFLQILEMVFKNDDSKNKAIILFIQGQKVNQQEQINWQEWDNQQFSAIQAKNRFLLLKKTISGKSYKQFSDNVKDLKKRLVKD